MNSAISSEGSGAGTVVNRIVGGKDSTSVLANNAALETLLPDSESAADGLSGANFPPSEDYFKNTLDWDFSAVWRWENNHPVLR
jgi:hypothetical protein